MSPIPLTANYIGLVTSYHNVTSTGYILIVWKRLLVLISMPYPVVWPIQCPAQCWGFLFATKMVSLVEILEQWAVYVFMSPVQLKLVTSTAIFVEKTHRSEKRLSSIVSNWAFKEGLSVVWRWKEMQRLGNFLKTKLSRKAEDATFRHLRPNVFIPVVGSFKLELPASPV